MSSSDYKFNEKKTVPVSKVLEFEKALYTAAGMSEQDADCVARTLVEADEDAISYMREMKVPDQP